MKALLPKVVLTAGLFLTVLAPVRSFGQSVGLEFRSSTNTPCAPSPSRWRSSTYRARPGTSVGVSISTGPYYYRQRESYPYYQAPVYVAPPPVVYAPPPVVYSAPPVYYGAPVPQTSYVPPVPPVPPAPVAPAIDARLVQVQENLRRLGYYKGPVDGLSGTGTRNAIRAYQVDRGLPVTGRVDRDLLQDLGL